MAFDKTGGSVAVLRSGGDNDDKTYTAPSKPPTGCTCRTRADIDDRIAQNAGKQPRWVIAEFTAANCRQAAVGVKREATHALGAQPKHMRYRCSR